MKVRASVKGLFAQMMLRPNDYEEYVRQVPPAEIRQEAQVEGLRRSQSMIDKLNVEEAKNWLIGHVLLHVYDPDGTLGTRLSADLDAIAAIELRKGLDGLRQDYDDELVTELARMYDLYWGRTAGSVQVTFTVKKPTGFINGD